MAGNNQLAQTGTESSTITTTNCSICRGKKLEKCEAINRALGKGIPYRDIEAMTGVAYRTIGNHAQHLPAVYREAKEKSILAQSVDVEQEFKQQLLFAKKLRIAAEDYLSDCETGEIVLIPRATEISVVYEDLSDTNPKGNPKRKTDSLDLLLERAKEGNIEPKRTIIKHVDIRSFALDAIKTADATIDKFARLTGAYQKDRENDDVASKFKLLIEKRARDKDISYQDELKNFLDNYSDVVESEIKTKLASELIQ